MRWDGNHHDDWLIVNCLTGVSASKFYVLGFKHLKTWNSSEKMRIALMNDCGWINIGGIRDRTGLLGILFRTKWGTYLTSSFFGPNNRVTGK
jgi:hypothetical protein